MIFWHTFLQSLKLPKTEAMRNLNKIGMDITVVYMFLLILFISLPSFIQQLLNPSGLSMDINIFLFIIYFFIFFYLPLTIIIFVLISVLAYLCVGITNLLQRKLRFQILWKLIAYTATIPFLLYTMIALFYDLSMTFLWISLLYSLTLVIIMILSFPKRRIRK